MIKAGFVSAILPDLSFEQVVDFAAQCGYACVEVMCWPVGVAERRYAGVTHIDVANLDQQSIERINGLLQAKGVEISGLGYYPNPLDPETSVLAIDHLKKVIDAASALGLDTVNSFIGRDPGLNFQDNYARFKEVWPAVIEYAAGREVTVCIENCPMYFTDDEWPGGKNLASSPAIWRKLFEEIPSPHFALNYDPSHLVWQFIDYIRPIYEFRERIHHVHIKDAKIIPEQLDEVGILATPLSFHQPKLPGLGDVDWGAFFSALTDIGYQGPACVEVEDRAYEASLDHRKQALLQSRAYLRQYLP